MAAHESPRTSKLYDRAGDEITIDEVERIAIYSLKECSSSSGGARLIHLALCLHKAEQNRLALRQNDTFLESYRRVLRSQIRTIFKIIRNDFMHNFVNIEQTRRHMLSTLI
jgi:hypothetical protein